MPTAYQSLWNPPYFRETYFRPNVGATKNMINGKGAHASLLKDVASNQHWLALRDTDAINFLHKQLDEKTTVTEIDVGPFCEYVEFWFLVWRLNSGDRTTDIPYITVTCTDTSFTRTSNLIPGGEVSSVSTKSSIADAEWVIFKDINSNLTSNDPGAIRVNSSPAETWTRPKIEVTTSDGVVIYEGYYRVYHAPATLTVST